MSVSAGSVAGLAGLVVGEIEGSPAGVRGVASSWRQAAATVSEGAGLVGSTQAAVGSWQGQAAQAFTAATSQLDGDMGDVATALTTGAEALDAYATVLESAQHAAAELRTQAASLADSAEGDSATTVATAAALAGLAASFAALRAQVESAAAQAAATLHASLPSTSTGTASGDFNFKTEEYTSEQIEILKKQTGDDDSWGCLLYYTFLSWPSAEQGEAGDCYLLAPLQSLSQTPAGRQALRDNVRWDESQQAFIVTFYDNGKKVDIAVDDYYVYGNKHTPPSIISIYERAYGKFLVNHTDDDTLSDGYAGDAMRHITGQDAEVVNTDGSKFGFITYNQHHYSEREWEKIDEAVEVGRPVTGETSGGDFDGKETATVEASADINNDGKIDSTEAQNRAQYKLVNGHAYTVVDINDDYVTIRNPWNYNDQEGGQKGGATIRISREDYEKYFYRTAMGQVP